MTLIEGLWCFSTISTNIAVVLMMLAYRGMGRDIRKVQLELFRLNIRLTGREYGIQRMAEDTEVGE
jgi:hypothetical protein